MKRETKEYKTEPAAVIKKIASRWLFRWSLLIFPIILATFILSFFDYRFIFVALIEIFILMPMIIMNIWIVYGMKPTVARCSLLRRAIYDDEADILLQYQPMDNVAKLPENQIIKQKGIKNVELSKKHLIIVYGSRPDNFEMIPKDIFDDFEELRSFILAIFPTINQN